jgi:hypothetical protein
MIKEKVKKEDVCPKCDHRHVCGRRKACAPVDVRSCEHYKMEEEG